MWPAGKRYEVMKLWHHVNDTLSMLLEGSRRPLLEPQIEGKILIGHIAVASSNLRSAPAIYVFNPSLASSINIKDSFSIAPE